MPTSIALQVIVAYIDELLQVSKYDEGEPSNGLMVDAGQPVTRIAAAVNTSFASIRGASEAGAQLLLVHHTTWESIDLQLKTQKDQALRDASVSLYGVHAALDCAPEMSNADSLAALLGVQVEGRFAEYCGGLAGVYGACDGTFAQLAERASETLGVAVDSWENNQSFGRIGIVPGGAGMTPMMEEARSLGCDTYVTGEGSMYTKLFAREIDMNLIFGTHYATEAPGIKGLAERVAEQFKLPWSFVQEDKDIL
ncbi:MAG: Nif3-like dinuclear metal center hexameric protein [Chloroflexi bacterium]|nr:Nif3-like dinuclear metal center hexameric protein [Chloroflexota bacterium]